MSDDDYQTEALAASTQVHHATAQLLRQVAADRDELRKKLESAVLLDEHKRALAFHAETMAERNRLLTEIAEAKELSRLCRIQTGKTVEDLQQRLFNKDAEITRLTGQLADAERASAEHFKDCQELSKVVEEAREHYTAMAIVAYEDSPTKDEYFRAQCAHDRLHAALKKIDEP